MHNVAAAAHAAFKNGSVNECTIRYAKFESGDESLTKEDQRRPETVVVNEVLRVLVEKNPGNTVKDYAEELDVSLTTILCILKLIGKVKKIDKWVFHDLNENRKRKRF